MSDRLEGRRIRQPYQAEKNGRLARSQTEALPRGLP